MDAPTTPLPLNTAELAAAHCLLMVGGTFDPPHAGHVLVPQAARAAAFPAGPCGAHAWLVYVPAARSPFKESAPGASDAQRLAMLRLALDGVPSARIWTDELDRSAAMPSTPSYSVDSVRRARGWLDASGAGHVGLRLVIGADQAAEFHRWREAREIIRLAEPLVMTRAGYGGMERVLRAMHESGAWSGEDVAAWKKRIVGVDVPNTSVSSTAIREAIRRGLASGQTPEGIAPAVLKYIRENGLYRMA